MIPVSCALCAKASDLEASNNNIDNTAVRKHRRVFMSFALFHDELVVGFQTRPDLLPLVMTMSLKARIRMSLIQKEWMNRLGDHSHALIAQSI
jgi:hypothetical protein